MKYQLLGLLFLTAANTCAIAVSTNDFPIVLICKNAPGDQLDVGLSLVKNTAYFSYKTTLLDRPLVMNLSDPRSTSISGAGVHIKSDSLAGGGSILQISAQMNEALRVTRYAQFAIELKLDDQGAITPKELSYSKGIDAFPEHSLAETVDLAGMACTLHGL